MLLVAVDLCAVDVEKHRFDCHVVPIVRMNAKSLLGGDVLAAMLLEHRPDGGDIFFVRKIDGHGQIATESRIACGINIRMTTLGIGAVLLAAHTVLVALWRDEDVAPIDLVLLHKLLDCQLDLSSR